MYELQAVSLKLELTGETACLLFQWARFPLPAPLCTVGNNPIVKFHPYGLHKGVMDSPKGECESFDGAALWAALFFC